MGGRLSTKKETHRHTNKSCRPIQTSYILCVNKLDGIGTHTIHCSNYYGPSCPCRIVQMLSVPSVFGERLSVSNSAGHSSYPMTEQSLARAEISAFALATQKSNRPPALFLAFLTLSLGSIAPRENISRLKAPPSHPLLMDRSYCAMRRVPLTGKCNL